MRLTKPLCTAVVVAVAQVSFAAVLQPTSVRKLDTAAAAVAWLNDQTLLPVRSFQLSLPHVSLPTSPGRGMV